MKTKRKAFTLIELLIVIAIIGILFIVLVSKVDFATDKAKASGVQTDFRSFQVALESVSKEKAGFNSFGWNTGDTNGDRIRNSYDEGDKACTENDCDECAQDGVMGPHEVWTGHKVYTEDWNAECYYTLIKPGTTFADAGYDKDAIFALETAINKNLDPKLHITIDAKTGLITMANGAQDPWDTQYHGAYISAEDGMDRGAIVMYSNGANQKFGSEHSIANGVPTVIVPGNNKNGQDDYSLVVVYTYANGFGEVGNLTTGFSNNQSFLAAGTGGGTEIINPENPNTPVVPEQPEWIDYEMLDGKNQVISPHEGLTIRSEADISTFVGVKVDGDMIDSSNYTVREGSIIVTLSGDYVKTLDIGNHNIEIVSNNGSASTDFQVNYVLSGCWDLDYFASSDVPLEQMVTFTLSDNDIGTLYGIRIEAPDAYGENQFYYLDEDGWSLRYWTGGGLPLRNLDFGNEPQVVSKEFYEWFMLNALPAYKISGQWEFNNTITINNFTYQSVNFESNDMSFTYIEVSPKMYGYNNEVVFVNYSEDLNEHMYNDGEFNDAYRIVNFGTTSQVVSYDFYMWLIANAKQI